MSKKKAAASKTAPKPTPRAEVAAAQEPSQEEKPTNPGLGSELPLDDDDTEIIHRDELKR